MFPLTIVPTCLSPRREFPKIGSLDPWSTMVVVPSYALGSVRGADRRYDTWRASLRRSNMMDPSPLQTLADSTATKREIKEFLEARVVAHIELALANGYSLHRARAFIRGLLERQLRARAFARFNKKKMLDKVVAEALRNAHYEFNLWRIEHHNEKIRKERVRRFERR